MTNNEFALESFINFCDDMIIAEERFSIKKMGHSLVEFIKKIKKFINGKLKKDKSNPEEEIRRLKKN